MFEGQNTTEKEIISNGYVYDHEFGLWKVYLKNNSFLYWNTKTNVIDRVAKYESRNR